MRARVVHPIPAAVKKGHGHIIPFRLVAKKSRSLGLVPAPPTSPSMQDITDVTLHAVRNCLQKIGMGLDLWQLTAPIEPKEHERLRQNVDNAGCSLLELQEYLCPPTPQVWTGNLASTVEQAVYTVAPAWQQANRTTRVVCHDPLAEFSLDWRQIGKAVERLVTGAQALLPEEGGEVLVESGVRVVKTHPHIGIQVQSRSAAPLSIEESAVFAPFVTVNRRPLGLSLVLVQQAIRRMGGQLFFHKPCANQGVFSLLLRTLSE
ncbi:MAG: HAMP domain-containing histidine kinase [Deltaproteobacteria bacterium]|nr:HAMP domain-containing histidine kinase [Deltaproteobacteria bacterium]